MIEFSLFITSSSRVAVPDNRLHTKLYVIRLLSWPTLITATHLAHFPLPKKISLNHTYTFTNPPPLQTARGSQYRKRLRL